MSTTDWNQIVLVTNFAHEFIMFRYIFYFPLLFCVISLFNSSSTRVCFPLCSTLNTLLSFAFMRHSHELFFAVKISTWNIFWLTVEEGSWNFHKCQVHNFLQFHLVSFILQQDHKKCEHKSLAWNLCYRQHYSFFYMTFLCLINWL